MCDYCDRYAAQLYALSRISLTGPAVYALVSYLISKSDDSGGVCAGYDELRSELGFSNGTISTALKMAKAFGLIDIKHNFQSYSEYSISPIFRELESTSLLTKGSVVNSKPLKNRELDEYTGYGADIDYPDEKAPEEPTLFMRLSDAFTSNFGIQYHAPGKWNPAIQRLIDMGAQPADIESAKAFNDGRERPYPVAGPWSIENMTSVEVGKRNRPGKRKPKAEYVSEVHGDPNGLF